MVNKLKCLINLEYLFRSLLVFREMFDIHKEADAGTFLCMSRFCYEKLGFYHEGQNLARMALASEAAKARPWLAARYIFQF
jgi:hypothetical protein